MGEVCIGPGERAAALPTPATNTQCLMIGTERMCGCGVVYHNTLEGRKGPTLRYLKLDRALYPSISNKIHVTLHDNWISFVACHGGLETVLLRVAVIDVRELSSRGKK